MISFKNGLALLLSRRLWAHNTQHRISCPALAWHGKGKKLRNIAKQMTHINQQVGCRFRGILHKDLLILALSDSTRRFGVPVPKILRECDCF